MDEKEQKDKELTVSKSILYVSRIWLYMSLGALLLYFLVSYAELRARSSKEDEIHARIRLHYEEAEKETKNGQ